ncbi:hypothetical protein [Algibacter sp. 2305UL17-15]|uniref:hypothetical protein n=1 Tax=Algibacter sp. 2305UL17-15 TaxID=3231268 RepID=UPI003459E275
MADTIRKNRVYLAETLSKELANSVAPNTIMEFAELIQNIGMAPGVLNFVCA